jgi:AcrR family transcriptional regulator
MVAVEREADPGRGSSRHEPRDGGPDPTDAAARPGLRERKKEQTRQALEAAALALFVEKGFDGTTVDEIAEACDVSQRTFFRYYSAKEDVLFADGDERLGALLDTLAARPVDEAPLRAVQAAFLATTELYAQDRERLLLRSRIFDSSSSLRSHKYERQRSWEDAVTAVLVERERKLDGDASTRHLRLVAGTSMSCLRAALDEWLDHGGDLTGLVATNFDDVATGLAVDRDRLAAPA